MSEKIKSDDEGPANFWVVNNPKEKVVFLNFDKPVAWVALTPEMAERLGNDLVKHAHTFSITKGVLLK